MNTLFISYRRDDSVGYSGRLADRLALEFGENQIFRDFDDIKPGQNFVESLEKGLSSADLLLVMMGENWLNIKSSTGQRRLDDAKDFVRLEIETALKRGIPIIPILINGASMPNAQDLPPSLSALTLHQAVRLNDSRWDQDIANLIMGIRDLTGLESLVTTHPSHRPGLYWALSACVLIAMLILLFMRQTAFSGQWYFEGGDYLVINQQGQQVNIEHIDPSMQKIYGRGSGQIDGLTLKFDLDPIYTDRFKYQASLTKSWDGQILKGELLEILSNQRSELILKKPAEK